MHLIPEQASGVGCIVSLDPGSETLGVADFLINVETLEILGCSARTFKASKLSLSNTLVENHSALFARTKAHYDNLLSFLRHREPFAVVSEAPFFSKKFPQAFAPLVLILNAIRSAVQDYHSQVQLTSIDPPTVKKAVGAPGNAGKPEMRTAVLRLKDLNYNGALPIDILDEHAIDAIAVGYCKILQLRQGRPHV
jgi:Holliday junction resolvasome RuvABC endonuclease subunit